MPTTTKLERLTIERAIALTATPVVSRNLIAKLDSADFTLGWAKAHERVRDPLRFVLAATAKELRQYARTPLK